MGEVDGSLGLFLGMSLVQIYREGFKILRDFIPGVKTDGKKRKRVKKINRNC